MALDFHTVHFIGIGGVGMSGLATILRQRGIEVTGTDAADSLTLERMERLGARIQVGHDAAHLGSPDLVVFSSAVAEENPELAAARRQGIPCLRRGEFLAQLATAYELVIPVAGSHGKTTTTAMITHILRQAGLRPGFLIGGDVNGWAASAATGAGRILVTEVDESDGTQALMRSTHAVVTNVDDDHCWSLGGVEALEQCFVTYGMAGRRLYCWESPTLRRLFAQHPAATFLGLGNIPPELQLPIPGQHNRWNATVALAVAVDLGVSREAALLALSTFPGVSRRLSQRYSSPGDRTVIIEDYAHHPEELKATLQALREGWPKHRLTVIFQPHRFERVKRYGRAFAEVLEQFADEVVLTAPFAAWRQDNDLADPRQIAAAVTAKPSRFWDRPLEELAADLAGQIVSENRSPITDHQSPITDHRSPITDHSSPILYAVIGAGDIGRLPALLRERLSESWLDTLRDELQQAFPEIPLERTRFWAELTTLGVGRSRPLLARPAAVADLQKLLQWTRVRNVPVLILGAGSNVAGTDWEPPRLIIQLRQGEFLRLEARDDAWEAGAGVTLAELYRGLLKAKALAPTFAPLAWIPGTLGGAVRMNAGAHGSTIGEFVAEVRGLDPVGREWRLAGAEIAWDYRRSSLAAAGIVTGVLLRFPPPQVKVAELRYRETGEKRRLSQPAGHSAGCVFRNPGDAAAGLLLDRAGVKGMSVGGCQVSDRHANVIVTDGRAAEKDFVRLLLKMRQRVFDQSGVILMPEVVLTGKDVEKQVKQSVESWRIAVLKGGPSSERPVSLRSGAAVAKALREAGHIVDEIDFDRPELPPIPAGVDVVFPVLHGEFGEDGQIQALMDARGLRYVGSSAAASRRIMDKIETKKILQANGIPTPNFACIPDFGAPLPAGLGFPLVVKPNNQGSTIGMSKVNSPAGGWWRRALKKAFVSDRNVFAEEFIRGREITVGLLHGKALPVIEIVPPGGRMFDYDAKYDHKYGHTRYLCPPASVSAEEQERAQELAVRIFHVLGAKDLLRVDFIVDRDGTPWTLEANAIPGFTATSLLPKAAQTAGISFTELCVGLVRANL